MYTPLRTYRYKVHATLYTRRHIHPDDSQIVILIDIYKVQERTVLNYKYARTLYFFIFANNYTPGVSYIMCALSRILFAPKHLLIHRKRALNKALS